ncbi:MAG: winged helix-turn-helix transcriptional regulator [Planctomycetes bacterium]|nr:winged helix-turn-helix transcriptional regulator [Planctomycetota bacterium]
MRSRSNALQVKAKLFRGLADVSRLAILEALRRGPKNVSQIVRQTGLRQPNASMHLNCLWCCGLVDRFERGRFTYYRMMSDRTRRVLRAAAEVLKEVGDHIAECARYEERA